MAKIALQKGKTGHSSLTQEYVLGNEASSNFLKPIKQKSDAKLLNKAQQIKEKKKNLMRNNYMMINQHNKILKSITCVLVQNYNFLFPIFWGLNDKFVKHYFGIKKQKQNKGLKNKYL